MALRGRCRGDPGRARRVPARGGARGRRARRGAARRRVGQGARARLHRPDRDRWPPCCCSRSSPRWSPGAEPRSPRRSAPPTWPELARLGSRLGSRHMGGRTRSCRSRPSCRSPSSVPICALARSEPCSWRSLGLALVLALGSGLDARASVEPARLPRRGGRRDGDADRVRGVVGGHGARQGIVRHASGALRRARRRARRGDRAAIDGGAGRGVGGGWSRTGPCRVVGPAEHLEGRLPGAVGRPSHERPVPGPGRRPAGARRGGTGDPSLRHHGA